MSVDARGNKKLLELGGRRLARSRSTFATDGSMIGSINFIWMSCGKGICRQNNFPKRSRL